MTDGLGDRKERIQQIRVKISQHDISGALGLLKEEMGHNPQDTEVLNLMAVCNYTLGDMERAETFWQKVLDINPENRTALSRLENFRAPSFQFWLKRYQQAVNEIERRNYQAAIVILKELLVENDGFVKLYQLLGLCYLAVGEYNRANLFWKRGLGIDVSNEKLIHYMHSSFKQKGETQAGNSGEKMEQKNMDSGSGIARGKVAWGIAGVLCLAVIIQMGLYFRNNGEGAKNAGQPKVAVTSQEQQPLAVMTAANEIENIKEAGEVGASNENSGGSDYDVEKEKYYYYEGYNAYKIKDYGKAARNLAMVVSMDTGSYLHREALYYLARTNYLQDKYQEAIEYYLLYLEKFPDTNYYDDSLYYLGCTYYLNGEKEKARETLVELKEFAPDCGYIYSDFYNKVMQSKHPL